MALRTQLVRISQTPTDKLDPEIGRLADMDISTQRVAECRDSCLEAYEAIADAQRTSAMAESIISGLTDAGTDDGAPAPTDDVADRMQKATELLEISEEKLDAARKAKDECHEKLAALEAEGLDRNR